MKRIQIQSNGVRTIQSKKGCNNCIDCVHCEAEKLGECTLYYICCVQHKNGLIDHNFPYDNTKCKEFKDASEEQQENRQ